MNAELKTDLFSSLEAALAVPLGQAQEAMEKALHDVHPADVAEVVRDMEKQEALAVFNWLDNDRAAFMLGDVESDLRKYLLDNAPSVRITELLDLLPMDDAADVVSEVEPEKADEILADLESMSPEDAAEVRELLSYGEDTAGRLMTDKLVTIAITATVEQALAAVRSAEKDIETLTDLYVVEKPFTSWGRLLGVISLRELVAAKPRTRVGTIMQDKPIFCTVDTDQSEVARLIAKYDLFALPVLDRQADLVGIVTVDDVIDVLTEEFNEDLLRFVGSDAAEMERRSPLQIAKLRLPWLMGTLLIELMAASVVKHYDALIAEVTLLASFMPVISAISGNIGLQAAAIVVRGLGTGHVSIKDWPRAVNREMATALLLALVCGTTLGAVGAIWSHKLTFGFVIGIAMICSILTAGFMGTVIPMLSKRLGFDPATTAGPFETAFQDVIGFAVFLWLASTLIHWLK